MAVFIISFFHLGIVKRKTLVLDLDETLIHSFHDGVLRPTVSFSFRKYFKMHDIFFYIVFFFQGKAGDTARFYTQSHHRSTPGEIFCSQATTCGLFSPNCKCMIFCSTVCLEKKVQQRHRIELAYYYNTRFFFLRGPNGSDMI